MKTYSDKIPANARVTIDYQKKQPTVVFDYPEKDNEKTLQRKYYFNYFDSHYNLIYITAITLLMAYQGLKAYGQSFTPQKQLILWTIIILGFYIPPYIAYLLIPKIPKFQEYWPALNKYSILNHLGRRDKTLTIDQIKHKTFTIPMFNNVYLAYKCYGDFATQLAKIKIREHQFDKTTPETTFWYAKIQFKKKPKNGHMKLEFR